MGPIDLQRKPATRKLKSGGSKPWISRQTKLNPLPTSTTTNPPCLSPAKTMIAIQTVATLYRHYRVQLCYVDPVEARYMLV